MSIGSCIPGLVAEGKLTKKQGETAQAAYDRYYRRFSGEMGPVAAAAQASEAALNELEFAARLRKRRQFLQVEAQRVGDTDIARFSGGSPYAAVRAMMGRDIRGPYENVEGSAQRIEFGTHGRLADFIEHFRRNMLGKTPDKAGMLDVVDELHGKDTTNPQAKTFADAVRATFEELRQRFNAAGGAIGKLKDFGLPHHWDPLRVRNTAYDAWRADMLAELAPERMVDNETGGAFTPETLDDALRGAYDSIRTNGLNGEPGSGIAGSVANRRSDHRFFVFKDGAAWLRIHEKYGVGDPFSIIMGHIRGMSHDIATMERFGPNPDASVRYLLDRADRIEAQSDKPAVGAVTGTSGGRRKAEKLWASMKGEFSAPVFPEGQLEKAGMIGVKALAGTRDVLSAALLGSAPITAIADIATQSVTLGFNDLPRMGIIRGYIEQLASRGAKEEAAELGLGLRDASHALLGLNRYFADMSGPRITSVIADDVLRASGLNKFTEAGQQWFGRRLLGEVAKDREKGFGELSPLRQEAMGRYGIDAGMWDAIRAADIYHGPTGRDYLNLRTIADQKAADRMMDWALGETAAAVQEATAMARAMLVADRPGTFWGEFGRNVVQFKTFTLALMMTHGQRMAMLPPGRRIAYGAEFFIGVTLMGALALQAREIVKGRDPRPMDRPEFLFDAMVQGGGAGVFGDLVGSFNNDRIGSVAAFAGGPMMSLAEDVKNTFVADAKADEEHRRVGKHAVRLLTRYTPGSNLWYLRTAFQREVMDRLQQQIDPTYYESWNMMEEHARKQGQDFWWKPGQAVPGRAPDAATAIGAPPR